MVGYIIIKMSQAVCTEGSPSAVGGMCALAMPRNRPRPLAYPRVHVKHLPHLDG